MRHKNTLGCMQILVP